MTAPDRDPGDGSEPSLSTSLLQQLRCQDDLAWQRLVALYGPTVLGWCRHAGLSPEEAEDVHQEVFCAVIRGIGSFRRERPGDSFRGWLWTVTRHKVIDQRRRARQAQAAGGSSAQQRLAQVPEECDPGEPEPAELSAEADAVHRRALGLIQGAFAEQTWRAFWAVTVDGRPAVDVAAELGMSVGAVYIAKSRVVRRLREEFAGLL